MASHIERRKFLATLGGAAGWSLVARAQQPQQMRRVGVLLPAVANDPEYQARVGAFMQALALLGWTDGRNVQINTRWAAGDDERLRKLAADVGRDPAGVALAFRVHRHGASAPAKADNGERFLFSGSNAEIIEDLRAMRELGVKAIDFNFAVLTVDAMRRFHEEVVAKS